MENNVRKLEDRPKVQVTLVGGDGNAFAVMGRTTSAMRKVGWSQEEIDEYTKEAMSGDYDHLLQTTMKFVEVD